MKITSSKKFQVYNSLFLSLYYQNSNHIGHLIPLLGQFAKNQLENEIDPVDILDNFYASNKAVIGVDKIGFMFKVIQYVERQVVLFDSIEDAISPYDLEDQDVFRVKDMFGALNNDEARKGLLQKLNDFSVRVVLTAHPTQFYRPPVLDIIAKLRSQIAENNIEAIDSLLHQLGLTSLINSKSPRPIDEAVNIIHICRYYYYHAIGELYYELLQEFPELDNPNLIVLGFWPCGDRDGNPFVTHETTRNVIDTLRLTLMKCYYNDIKVLCAKLTFKEIEEPLNQQRKALYEAMFDARKIVDHKDILQCLISVKQILIEKYESLYLADLERLIVKVSIFKNHFASLDIRQDHSVHLSTVEYILKSNNRIKDSINELEEAELVQLLTEEFIDIPENIDNAPLVEDTIKNIAQLPALQQSNGLEGCHRYIISNSEDIYAVLFVLGLIRWVSRSDRFDFDIIPLFETMKGMANCEAVMNQLFSNKIYRDHVASRDDRQTIMLGFSDGTKDGGYLKANWSIFKSKEILTAVCNKYDVKAAFFDGRGGPPARGGGKTHKFYAALGSGIANNEIQMTVQGQTITSTYGTPEKFKFNAEQMVTSGLFSFLNRDQSSLSSEVRALIEDLSEISYKKYQELKAHPKFLPYLEKMTTLKYYSMATIGSRPSKRNKNKKLTLSDLRAISYVGSWSQLKQNIPGYFGVGTAIYDLKKQGRIEEVRALYRNAPFFKTLIDNCMMSLTKCFFELTAYMKSNDEFRDFWLYLHEEYTLSKAMVLEITGFETLMQDESTTKASIQTRESIVLPLVLIQNYALQKLLTETDEELRAFYQKIVTRSLYGNINASRNSA